MISYRDVSEASSVGLPDHRPEGHSVPCMLSSGESLSSGSERILATFLYGGNALGMTHLVEDLQPDSESVLTGLRIGHP